MIKNADRQAPPRSGPVVTAIGHQRIKRIASSGQKTLSVGRLVRKNADGLLVIGTKHEFSQPVAIIPLLKIDPDTQLKIDRLKAGANIFFHHLALNRLQRNPFAGGTVYRIVDGVVVALRNQIGSGSAAQIIAQ